MIGIVYSRLRIEEKLLLEAFAKQKIQTVLIDPREIMLGNGKKPDTVSLVLNREISQIRSELILKYFESLAVKTINTTHATETCNNKAVSSWLLEKAGIPTPKTYTVFSLEQALQVAEELMFPLVVKPIVGSWGRLLVKVDNKDTLIAIIEHKEALANPYQKIFYLQEYREKPERDIRILTVGKEPVAAMYRTSEHWITNTAKGGYALKCTIDSQLHSLVTKVIELFAIDIAGIDVLETKSGYEVLEVNSTPEFHGLQTVADKNIADYIATYVNSQSKNI